MTKPANYTYEELLARGVSYHPVTIEGELFLQLDEGVSEDRYVWRFGKMDINDDDLLEFEVECVNCEGPTPEGLYQYAGAILCQILEAQFDSKHK